MDETMELPKPAPAGTASPFAWKGCSTLGAALSVGATPVLLDAEQAQSRRYSPPIEGSAAGQASGDKRAKLRRGGI